MFAGVSGLVSAAAVSLWDLADFVSFLGPPAAGAFCFPSKFLKNAICRFLGFRASPFFQCRHDDLRDNDHAVREYFPRRYFSGRVNRHAVNVAESPRFGDFSVRQKKHLGLFRQRGEGFMQKKTKMLLL